LYNLRSYIQKKQKGARVVESIAIGAASSLLPSIVDLFSGAGRRRRLAREAQIRAVDQLIRDINAEAGASVEDSALYKSNQAFLDKRFRHDLDVLGQKAAASGETPEAQLGRLQTINEARTRGMMDNLLQSYKQRQSLKNQAQQLSLRKLALDSEEAENDVLAQRQFSDALVQAVPAWYSILSKN
jgi:hypothetical protein